MPRRACGFVEGKTLDGERERHGRRSEMKGKGGVKGGGHGIGKRRMVVGKGARGPIGS